jgi:large subunit ribosomal protein L31
MGRIMKEGIHPEYEAARITCSCGHVLETRSTTPEIHVEVCSACHPFYTGKQKIMDVAGRVERFNRRYGKQGKAAPSGESAES